MSHEHRNRETVQASLKPSHRPRMPERVERLPRNEPSNNARADLPFRFRFQLCPGLLALGPVAIPCRLQQRNESFNLGHGHGDALPPHFSFSHSHTDAIHSAIDGIRGPLFAKRIPKQRPSRVLLEESHCDPQCSLGQIHDTRSLLPLGLVPREHPSRVEQVYMLPRHTQGLLRSAARLPGHGYRVAKRVVRTVLQKSTRTPAS